MILMLIVVALYTICSLNDKYAVSKAKYSGAQLTFMMSAGTVVFLIFALPFSDLKFTMSPLSFLFNALIALSKYLEFSMSAKILIDMSVFELKAWLGITLFLSYFTDVFMYNHEISIVKILFIVATIAGLVMIAASGRKRVNYKKIVLPLIFYLGAKFSYGFIMKSAETYISSTLTLFFALIVLAVLMLPLAKPWLIPKTSPEGKKGMLIILACKLPNTLGLLGENAVAAQSLTNYSFIQPMILIVVFISSFIGKARVNVPTKLGLIGSIAVIIGILGFQIF